MQPVASPGTASHSPAVASRPSHVPLPALAPRGAPFPPATRHGVQEAGHGLPCHTRLQLETDTHLPLMALKSRIPSAGPQIWTKSSRDIFSKSAPRQVNGAGCYMGHKEKAPSSSTCRPCVGLRGQGRGESHPHLQWAPDNLRSQPKRCQKLNDQSSQNSVEQTSMDRSQ